MTKEEQKCWCNSVGQAVSLANLDPSSYYFEKLFLDLFLLMTIVKM